MQLERREEGAVIISIIKCLGGLWPHTPACPWILETMPEGSKVQLKSKVEMKWMALFNSTGFVSLTQKSQ